MAGLVLANNARKRASVMVEPGIVKYHLPPTDNLNVPGAGSGTFSGTGQRRDVPKPRFFQVRTSIASKPQNIPGGHSAAFGLVGFKGDPNNASNVYIITDEQQGTDGMLIAAGDTTPYYLLNCSLASVQVYSTATGQIVYFWGAGKYVPE